MANNLLNRFRGVAFGAVLAMCATGVAQASEVYENISWTGGGGYTMTGTFSYSSSLSGPITGSQVDSLFIEGFLGGSPVGSWDLSSGYAGFLFNFNFNDDVGIRSGRSYHECDGPTLGRLAWRIFVSQSWLRVWER